MTGLPHSAEKDAVVEVLRQHGQVLLNGGDLACSCGMRPWTRGMTGMEHTRHVASVLVSKFHMTRVTPPAMPGEPTPQA